jgi:hypothetical protein
MNANAARRGANDTNERELMQMDATSEMKMER